MFGGYQSAVNDSIEQYNVLTDTWLVLDVNMPERLWQHGCCPLSQRHVLVFGGEGSVEAPNLRSIIFDTQTNEFHSEAALPETNAWLFFWLMPVRVGQNMYAMNKEQTVLEYSIDQNAWAVLSKP